jgi:hypothetical protein
MLYARDSDPLPIVQEAGWVSGPVCTGDKPDFLMKSVKFSGTTPEMPIIPCTEPHKSIHTLFLKSHLNIIFSLILQSSMLPLHFTHYKQKFISFLTVK